MKGLKRNNAVGVKGRSGRKPVALEFTVRAEVNKFKPIFWKKLKEWINCGDKELEKLSIVEFNKIQIKLIPTEVTGKDGAEFILKIVDYDRNKDSTSTKTENI